MELSRRSFLKLSGLSLAGTLGGGLEGTLNPLQAYLDSSTLRIGQAKEITTICPYCGVGCGQVVTVRDGTVIRIEGNPDHPINQGALCSKGSALYQMADNPERLTKVHYRPPGGSRWEEKDWDWTMARLAAKIKTTREAHWLDREKDVPVRRTEAIACLGGAALDNEEGYLLSKAMRGLGIVFLEHQARI